MAAAAAPAVAVNGIRIGTTSPAYLENKAAKETRALISGLCRYFYTLGSIAIKVHDDSIPKPRQLIVMSPSGVDRERMESEDMYVLSYNRSITSAPSPKPYPHKPPKSSDWGPLFMKHLKNYLRVQLKFQIPAFLNQMHTFYEEYFLPFAGFIYSVLYPFCAYERRHAGAVIHSHGIESSLPTMKNPLSMEFQAEYYSYLFDAAIKLHHLGLYWSTPNYGPKQRVQSGLGKKSNVSTKATKSDCENDPFPRCIVLDIEGTTTPISFVTEVLFPYARDNVGRHLSATYDTPETQDDIKLLRSQVQSDLEQGVAGAVPIPPDDAGKEVVIAALVANVEAMIKADRKITALKELQGHIWRTGFENNKLKAIVYDDVPEALKKWHALGTKVYIYSSGSRLAQRLIFGNTNCGDLRKYLSGFFDTAVGNKRERRSYVEISETLGVDKSSDILFLTDVFQEATAAKEAGLEVMISIRPGNGPLPENHGFKTINSFLEI